MLSTRIVVQTRPHMMEGTEGNEGGGEEEEVRNKTRGRANFEGKKEHRSKEVNEERKEGRKGASKKGKE